MRRRYRLGQTDSAASGFLNPRTGNLLIGVGALGIVGTVSYYIFKGGEIGDLFGELFKGGGSAGGRSQFVAPRENVTLRRTTLPREIPATPEGKMAGLAMIPRFTPSYSYGATDVVPGVRPDTW